MVMSEDPERGKRNVMSSVLKEKYTLVYGAESKNLRKVFLSPLLETFNRWYSTSYIKIAWHMYNS